MALLSPAEINDAVSLGKAIRLGAMISGAQAGSLDNAVLQKTDEYLLLALEGAVDALNGEIVEKRLGSLARAFGLKAKIVSPD